MMITRPLPWVAIAALGISAPAHAARDEGNVTPATETEQPASDDGVNAANRIICRRYPPPVGSRIGARRICATQSQWDRHYRQHRDLLDEAFNRSKI